MHLDHRLEDLVPRRASLQLRLLRRFASSTRCTPKIALADTVDPRNCSHADALAATILAGDAYAHKPVHVKRALVVLHLIQDALQRCGSDGFVSAVGVGDHTEW